MENLAIMYLPATIRDLPAHDGESLGKLHTDSCISL